MKIIGKISSSEFIISIDKYEIMSIFGCSNDSQLPKGVLEVGSVFDANLIFKHLRKLREHNDTLVQAASSLRYFAGLLGPVDELIKEAITIPEQEEESAP